MTTMSRGSISSVKKAASTAEAPVWKSYLAIRSSTPSDVPNATNVSDRVSKSTAIGNSRGRKRSKPSGGAHGPGTGIWMTLATPLTREEDGGAVLTSVRRYWEQLSVNERQQILFLDEAELVKQLYKLNLSLLCVGLMQRHLKTSNRTATDAVANNKKAAAVASKTTASKSVASTPVVQEQAATQPSARAATDTSLEKTYELLEAMEFMDIGTGILTVKTELAEDTDRLFTLVGDVLAGFLTSIHVLTESNFNKLFVTESETINTWANYQRLIAMLVEQLILRSYATHLEKEAALQMEQLLLEVSLEDKAAGHTSTGNSASHNKKKSKKKKKKNSAVHADADVQQNATPERTKDQANHEPTTRNSDGTHLLDSMISADPSDETLMEEPALEPTPEIESIHPESDCQSNSSTAQTDEVTVEEDEATPAEVGPSLKKLSALNPNALVFQPQEHAVAVEDVSSRNPSAGKRKFDEYIVSVPWEDVESDVGSAFDIGSVDGDLFDREEEADDEGAQQWGRRKQRRRQDDAELEWQLQQVYAATSSLFGWDFLRQCELPDPCANLSWSEETLWRTAPKEVVRYFSPGNGDAYARFHVPHFLPPEASPPPSRYYFNPGQPMPFGPPLLAPRMELMPPHLHGSFGYQSPEFPMVVSPDFSIPQYQSTSNEDQVDI
ncbi:hypothetical protein L914_07709 [Phytophthora nicotianae]|uniref:Uncharacterized protein n=1 Tax=Phytophthora nicotianae TaxID=4792 RepID=W2NGH0_PHYNI|nr:hypothetical protein L914_07709 [Phytophthora nicotianae]